MRDDHKYRYSAAGEPVSPVKSSFQCLTHASRLECKNNSLIKLSIFNSMVFQELKVVNSSLVNPLTLSGIAASQFSTVEELSSSLLA